MSDDIWDAYWRGTSIKDAGARLSIERESLRFKRLVEELERRLGSMAGLNLVELGAGPGTTTIAFGQLGANATLVDRAESALDAASALAREAGIDAAVVEADLFAPPPELAGTFDAALSFGVAEHFAGEQRTAVFAAHASWVRPGGVAVVSVPNSLCVSYRLWKWALERRGRWPFGFEQPFTPLELRRQVRAVQGADFRIVASSAVRDLLDFATPVIAAKLMGRLVNVPRPEVPSPLDPVLGYALSAVFTRTS